MQGRIAGKLENLLCVLTLSLRTSLSHFFDTPLLEQPKVNSKEKQEIHTAG